MKPQTKSLAVILILFGLISGLFGNTGSSEAGKALADENLTEEQLAGLTLANLAQRDGVPVLPLYSISQSVAIQSLNGPVYRPAGSRPLVALQVGHWQSAALPAELAGLRNSQGANAAGVSEIEVGQDIARRVAFLLQPQNVEVKILPATVPNDFSADVFLSLHSDWGNKPDIRGFKIARSRYSRIPQTDDRLLDLLYKDYQDSTSFPWEGNLTINMTAYYAFNHQSFHASLSNNTPAAILEMGFLTNPEDRRFLTLQADAVARGIANGITEFLKERQAEGYKPLEPASHLPTLRVKAGGNALVPVYAKDGQRLIAYVSNGQQFAYYEAEGAFYNIWLPVINQFGLVKAVQSEIADH